MVTLFSSDAQSIFEIQLEFFSLGSNLIEVSKKQACELCGEENSILADRKIKIASLELSTQAKNLDLVDQSGHYHHRKEIADVFNKPPSRNIHHSQLFIEARNQAIAESEKKGLNSEAKMKYQVAHGNVVGVVGQAGIGKTTLTKLIAQEVLYQGLYEADYVFYLRFRDIDYKNVMNFIQFLTNNSQFSNNITKKDLRKLLNTLSENSKVFLLFDGFDESSIKEESRPLQGNCSIYEKAKAEKFIKHLLGGNLLPKAKKLFTSRPRQLLQLHKTFRPRFIVNVLGLTCGSQKHICEDVCENEDACAYVFQFIEDRPDLKSFCYVPANCILVMHCINVNYRSKKLAALEEMDSITTIMVATLGLFTEGHFRGETLYTKNLSLLAYRAFLSNCLFFECQDLKEAGISIQQATTFLTARLGKNAALKLWEGIATARSYFSHLLLHEFFVAIYLIFFMKVNEFDQILSSLTENKYEMVAKFSFGLCNSVTQNYLQNFTQCEDLNVSHCIQKKEMLKSLALEKVASAQNFSDLLQCYSWLYELRDDEVTKKAVSKQENVIEVSGFILPSDIPAFQYVLLQRKSPLFLIVSHPYIDRDRRKSYFAALGAIFQSDNVKVILHSILCNKSIFILFSLHVLFSQAKAS